MAVQRGLESCHPASERLFADPLANVFVTPPWRLALIAGRITPARRLIEHLYDQFGGPGPRASAVARTRLIDDWLVNASRQATQIVILGAGFDSRAYRLPALAGRRVFEVDQPATQARKRRRLAGVRVSPDVATGRWVDGPYLVPLGGGGSTIVFEHRSRPCSTPPRHPRVGDLGRNFVRFRCLVGSRPPPIAKAQSE